jgi:hypothetical protein
VTPVASVICHSRCFQACDTGHQLAVERVDYGLYQSELLGKSRRNGEKKYRLIVCGNTFSDNERFLILAHFKVILQSLVNETSEVHPKGIREIEPENDKKCNISYHTHELVKLSHLLLSMSLSYKFSQNTQDYFHLKHMLCLPHIISQFSFDLLLK